MEHKTSYSDHNVMRTEYSPVNPDEYQPMMHSSASTSQQQLDTSVCRCTCRRSCPEKVLARRMQCDGTAELNNPHHHHQICDVDSIQRLEANGDYLRPHSRNTTGYHQDSYGEGILTSIGGQCLRQLTNLSGTYSAYQWSIWLVIFLSMNLSSCSAHPRGSTQERISTTEVDTQLSNTNFHRADEYEHLRYLHPQNDTNRVWSKIVRNSPYLTRGKKRSGRAGTKERTSFSEGMKRISAERLAADCQPRDTVLDSYEELGVPKGYDTFIFPDCFVVKRCKHGGCCRDDEECVPAEHAREEVSMLFLINRDPTNQYFMEKTIIQDTACECRRKPGFCPPPQVDCPNGKVWSYSECKCTCRYRCPKPFLQDEESCACDCLMSNRDCKNVSRGRKNRTLAREECDCVRRGLCATPPCVNGRFRESVCKCVQSWS